MNTKAAAVVSVLGLLAVFVLAIPVSAAPAWKVTLVSADAGSTQTATLLPQINYCIQCPTPLSCFKLTVADGGAQSADCSKDFNVTGDGFGIAAYIPGQMNPFTACFDTAGKTQIVAAQLDGGTVNCRVLQNERNK